MGFNLESADNLDSDGVFLSEPGTYHFVIDQATEPNEANEPAAKFECTCLAGTVEDCAGKRWDLGLFPPDRSKQDGDQRTKKLNTAVFVAIDMFDPRQLGQEREINVPDAVGRQFVVQLERKMSKNEGTGKWDVPTKFLRIAYANIYHVDDPAVKDMPKNADALGMIEAAQRHDASWFDFKKSSNGHSKSNGAANSVAIDVNSLDF